MSHFFVYKKFKSVVLAMLINNIIWVTYKLLLGQHSGNSVVL